MTNTPVLFIWEYPPGGKSYIVEITARQISHMGPVECDCKFLLIFGRRIVLMVSVLDYELSGLGLSSGGGYCVIFLGETFHSHSASLHSGVLLDISELLGIL